MRMRWIPPKRNNHCTATLRIDHETLKCDKPADHVKESGLLHYHYDPRDSILWFAHPNGDIEIRGWSG